MSFWSKNPSRSGAMISALMDAVKLVPAQIFWRAYEWRFRDEEKPNTLFVLPYGEFCENTRFLFEHFLASETVHTKPLLFVYDTKLFDRLKQLYPENTVLARSREGLAAFRGASVAITSRGSMQRLFLPYIFTKGAKTFINLWHGIPLKRLGVQAKDTWETLVFYGLQDFDVWLASSDTEGLALAACYGLSLDQIWVTGAPRNDALFRTCPAARRSGTRTILYAPTWRDGRLDARFLPFDDLNIDALKYLLEATDSRLVLRRHLVERQSPTGRQAGYDRIIEDDGTLYESTRDLLIDTDVLVTDYSSIYFDHLALDRPMIFVPYDLAQYESKRGFLLDYQEVTPGPKVERFSEFLSALEAALTDPSFYAEERRRVMDRFHKFQDGGACSRLEKKIELSARKLER